MTTDIILASTSRYRRELMQRLSVPFRALSPPIDEESYKDSQLSPLELAEHLAGIKAMSLGELHPEAIVIGADQVASCAGSILSKPGNFANAVQQLTMLAGRTHELITAIAIFHGGQLWRHVDITRLTMRPMEAAEIAAYLNIDEPYDCAGSYKLECRGITLFEKIESADHTAIVGLPLMALTSLLLSLGVPASSFYQIDTEKG
jgi:septum formation protein